MAEETTTTEAAASEALATKKQPMMHDGKPVMSVKIYAPFKMYYEGPAFSVSAVNATGPFDILPRHYNFLCMLVPCVIKVVTPDGLKEVKAHRALMHVESDSVVVFMDV